MEKIRVFLNRTTIVIDMSDRNSPVRKKIDNERERLWADIYASFK